MMSDVTVVGLVPDTVPLPDIGMDVPHGIVVRVPADKASGSKDLWRAINQRRVLKIQGGMMNGGPSTSALTEELEHLRSLNTRLELENTELRALLASKPPPPPPSTASVDNAKLDEILRMLQAGAVPRAASGGKVESLTGVVDVDTPSFIPANIRGENSGQTVEVVAVTSESDAVSDARSALRKLRQRE